MKLKVTRNSVNAEEYVPYQLASAYQALTTTVTDPVVMPTDFYQNKGSNVPKAFAKIYWDCHDDETLALTVMKERIRNAYQDIEMTLQVHLNALENFSRMQEAFKQNDRRTIINTANKILPQMRIYGELVEQHQKQRDANAFLSYPATVPGHIFYRKNTSAFYSLIWNQSGTKEENERAIHTLESLLPSFEKGTSNLSDVSLSHIPKENLLATNLHTAFLLLERAGFSSTSQEKTVKLLK